MAARYRELVPNPDVVLLAGIGHYPQLEAPERVLEAYLEFVTPRLVENRSAAEGPPSPPTPKRWQATALQKCLDRGAAR